MSYGDWRDDGLWSRFNAPRPVVGNVPIEITFPCPEELLATNKDVDGYLMIRGCDSHFMRHAQSYP
jgi:hypothetical protein